MYLMEDGDILYTQIGYEGLLIAPTPKKRFLIMRFSEENWKRYKNGEKIKVEIFFEVK